jgi:hypothetical protein
MELDTLQQQQATVKQHSEFIFVHFCNEEENKSVTFLAVAVKEKYRFGTDSPKLSAVSKH